MTIRNRERANMAVAYGILHGKTHEEIVDLLFSDGLLMPDNADSLLDTIPGLALANSAFREGRAEGRREVTADWDWLTRPRTLSPYGAELCKKIADERNQK